MGESHQTFQEHVQVIIQNKIEKKGGWSADILLKEIQLWHYFHCNEASIVNNVI